MTAVEKPLDLSRLETAIEQSNNIKDALRNYVFWDQKPEAFDVQDKAEQVSGPSPFATTRTEGPSVLHNYKPRRTTGALDSQYKYNDSTPEIGRTYYDLDLVEVLKSEELLHDLSVTISERGVVFIKSQFDLTVEQQKELVHKLGLKAGKPESSTLHIHPTALAGGVLNGDKIDPTVSLISSQLQKKLYRSEETKKPHENLVARPNVDSVWHSDITFEPVPADFSSLRIVETPSRSATEAELSKQGGGPVGGAGGDTLWASGYALAERVSPKLLSFLETLTGEFHQPRFAEATGNKNVPFYSAVRGAPENVGDELLAHHPVVRTNPNTGWKSIFAIGVHFKRFVELTDSESAILKDYLLRVLLTTPEIQVRYKWDAGDIAIWDNRSTYHTAVYDVIDHNGAVTTRTGLRTVGVGERPFLDPKSKLRYEALSERASA